MKARSYAMAIINGENSDKAQIDASDSLYLHPSDHSGQALVADIFNGENFENWR